MEEDTEARLAWSDARLDERWGNNCKIEHARVREASNQRILCAVLAPYDEVVSLPVFDPLHIMLAFAMVKDDVAFFMIDACAPLSVAGVSI